jgi:hypothetical protein
LMADDKLFEGRTIVASEHAGDEFAVGWGHGWTGEESEPGLTIRRPVAVNAPPREPGRWR